MKFKNTYRLFLTIFILIFSILLTSCSSLGFGTTMPTLDIQSEFENDNWLIIDNILINKTNNKIYPLEPDTNATIEGISNIFYYGPYTYKVEFDENTFKLYTFLKHIIPTMIWFMRFLIVCSHTIMRGMKLTEHTLVSC